MDETKDPVKNFSTKQDLDVFKIQARQKQGWIMFDL